MIRLVNLVFFVGCALLVAHYYGLGSTIELLVAVAVAVGLMRVLSKKRFIRDPVRLSHNRYTNSVSLQRRFCLNERRLQEFYQIKSGVLA
jgi:hypothetical protein